LRHVGHAVSLQQAGFRMRWFVGLGAALEKPVEVELDPGALPKEPVQLVMPPTGECEVRVLDPSGAPCHELVEVSLRVLPRDASLTELGERDHLRDALLPNCRDGTALFRHVELGRSFEVHVQRNGGNAQHRARGIGPTAAGQRAVIPVRLGERAPVLAGRVLDQSGAVLANARLRSRIEDAQDHNVEYSWQIQSDAEGHFQLDTNEVDGEPGTRTLTIYTVDERDQEFAAARRDLPAQLGPGVHELGDFVLASSPLLVSGSVVDEQGQPIKGASITPALKQFWDESNPQSFWWQELYASRGTSDDQGHFEIRARIDATELGVWASKKESKGEVVLVAPGASGVTLRVLATGEIAGVVLLDPSVPRDAVGIAVERDDAGSEPSNEWTPPSTLDEEGKFSIKGLKPANYSVQLNNVTMWSSVHSVADVHVDGGAVTRDARLNPLDLRASLRAFQLEIVDADERPIPQGMILARTPAATESDPIYSYFQNGRAVLFHSGLGLDLTVSCEGYRDVYLHAVSTNQKIVLRRGVDLRFHLARDLRAPEPPFYLGIQVEPAEGAHLSRAWFGEQSFFDPRGELTESSSVTGHAKLTLTITLRDERRWTMTNFDDGTERVIDIADRDGLQTFEVAFDQAKLDEQVKALRDSADQ
jgi:protocatechuate 3,4-dioxygenase beta subunit